MVDMSRRAGPNTDTSIDMLYHRITYESRLPPCARPLGVVTLAECATYGVRGCPMDRVKRRNDDSSSWYHPLERSLRRQRPTELLHPDSVAKRSPSSLLLIRNNALSRAPPPPTPYSRRRPPGIPLDALTCTVMERHDSYK